MTERTRFQIATFPGPGLENPYLELFLAALRQHGVDWVTEFGLERDWLCVNRDRVDAIHLHWPEVLWGRHRRDSLWNALRLRLSRWIPGAWRVYRGLDRIAAHPDIGMRLCQLRTFRGLMLFRKVIRRFRNQGGRVIWTLHNIEKHEGGDWIERWGYRWLARESDLIIFHSDDALKAASECYPTRARLVVMPHGNYAGFYPTPRERETVLRSLGLRADLPVVSCLGALRHYKGLDIACEAVGLLEGQVQFLCAGQPHRTFELAALAAQVATLENAVLIPRLLDDQEFADYASISDVILLPYRKVTGSGALLAALTLGRAVVASNLPYFRSILGKNSSAGRLVALEDPAALAQGIRDLLSIPATTRSNAAANLANEYAWSRVVLPVVQAIRAWSTHL